MSKYRKNAFVRSKSLGALLAATMLASPSGAQESDVATTTGGGDANIGYVTGDPDTWPAELEATVAAAENHKILLENDQVRVLEVTLAPGEVEPLHFHRWPSVLYLQQAGDWIDRDAEGNVIFDSRKVPPMPFPVTLWKGPEAPHSPVNLSDDVTVRLIRVEIKPQEAWAPGGPSDEYSFFRPTARSPTPKTGSSSPTAGCWSGIGITVSLPCLPTAPRRRSAISRERASGRSRTPCGTARTAFRGSRTVAMCWSPT